ncbi:MAG: hypothetical protein ACJ74W_04130 [Pyrinomonadaceae bacterium]
MWHDWQNIAVLLCVLAALAYVGRRGWARLRTLVGRAGKGGAGCATGCGSCGPVQAAPPQAKVLVQIGRAGVNSKQSAR